jgi:hypothetical protein
MTAYGTPRQSPDGSARRLWQHNRRSRDIMRWWLILAATPSCAAHHVHPGPTPVLSGHRDNNTITTKPHSGGTHELLRAASVAPSVEPWAEGRPRCQMWALCAGISEAGFQLRRREGRLSGNGGPMSTHGSNVPPGCTLRNSVERPGSRLESGPLSLGGSIDEEVHSDHLRPRWTPSTTSLRRSCISKAHPSNARARLCGLCCVRYPRPTLRQWPRRATGFRPSAHVVQFRRCGRRGRGRT